MGDRRNKIRSAFATLGVKFDGSGRALLPGAWFWNSVGEAIAQPARGVELVCVAGSYGVEVWNAADGSGPRESEQAPRAVVLACIADAMIAGVSDD